MLNIEQKKQSKYMVLEGSISIIVNIVLFVFKYIIGISTGSIAIIADAWHTLSDCVSSVIVIIGGIYSKKPADKSHPFGHGRIELITNFVIGIILLYIAYGFAKDGIIKFISKGSTQFGLSSLIIIIVSIVIKEALAQFSFWAGKKVNSISLISDGWHHRTDSISSIVILIGIFFGKYFWWIDSVLAIIVAIIIFITAIKILASTFSTMIGEEPKPEIIENIKKIAESMSGINEETFHHFHLHRYGSHTEITFHMYFPRETSVYNAHNAVTKLEDKIREDMSIEATIHIESK